MSHVSRLPPSGKKVHVEAEIESLAARQARAAACGGFLDGGDAEKLVEAVCNAGPQRSQNGPRVTIPDPSQECNIDTSACRA